MNYALFHQLRRISVTENLFESASFRIAPG